MEKIAKTGFYVSLISYVCFWLLDLLRPGFVARSFSVHLFLLAALMFGVWWGMRVKEYTDRPWIQLVIAIVFGILLSVITWNLGVGIGMWRVIVTVFVFFVPATFWRLIR